MCNTTIKDYLVAEATQDMFYKRSTPFPFRVLNVKYTTLVQEDRTGDARETHVRYRMLVNPDPDPRAYLALEAAVVPDDTAATALLKSPQFDPRRTAILDADPPSGIPRATVPPPPAPLAAPGARSLSGDGRVSTTEAGRCDLVSWNLNTLRLKTAAKAPAILVLSEGWYPGWRATVDGKDAPLYRAQVTLRAVAVPAGEHEVVFRFQPRSLRVGGLITGASLLALAAGVVFIRKSAFGEEPTAGGRRAAS